MQKTSFFFQVTSISWYFLWKLSCINSEGFFFVSEFFWKTKDFFPLSREQAYFWSRFACLLHTWVSMKWFQNICENCTLWKSLHVNFDILWLLSILLSTSLLKSLCTHRHYPQEAPSLVGSRWPSGVRKLPCRDLWSSY